MRWIIVLVVASLAAAACSSPTVVDTAPDAVWEIETGGFAAAPMADARSSIVVTDNAIVVNTFFRRNRTEYSAYDRTDRSQQWSRSLDVGGRAEIAIVNDDVVVAHAAEHRIVVLDAETGATLWGLDVDVLEGAAFTAAGLLVLEKGFGFPEAIVRTLEPRTGETVWEKVPPGGALEEAHLVTADLILAKTQRRLTALDVVDGAERWALEFADQPTQDDYAGGIGLRGDVGFVADPDGEILAFELATGVERWRVNIGKPVDSGPQTLVGVSETRVVTYDSTGLHAREIGDGSLAWQIPATDECWYLQALVSGDSIYATASEQIESIDPATGVQRWVAPLGPVRFSETITVGEHLVVVGSDAFVAVYSTDDGRMLLRVAPEFGVTIPVIADGELILSTEERIFAYDLDGIRSGDYRPTTTQARAPTPCGVAQSGSD